MKQSKILIRIKDKPIQSDSEIEDKKTDDNQFKYINEPLKYN